MQHHAPPPGPLSVQSPSKPSESTVDAPPKQVAQALDRLSHAARLIADIRLGADRLLEALYVAAQQSSNKPLNLILKEEASMRSHLHDLRSIGKKLEESGVLNESLRSRSNSWGLHMPLVCPDGAVVAYAWKRQLAGQAGASAVDRTRLALKAFTDQKRRFFPQLDDATSTVPASKRHCGSQQQALNHEEKLDDYRSLPDVLSHLEKEVPNVKIFTYERLDWLKRASSLASSTNESTIEPSSVHNFQSTSNFGRRRSCVAAPDKIAVIELLFPCVFRAVISLHPVGSTDSDAVSFFSPDEGGSYIQARGHSVHHVFKHITEHAAIALQYFLGLRNEKALYSLLHWVCGYHNLLSKICSKCGRLLSIDKHSGLLLPPICRPYQNFCVIKDQTPDLTQAYHIGCFTED